MMLHIKFDRDWQTDLRDTIISLMKIKSPSRARNSEVTDQIRPEFEPVQKFMPVLVKPASLMKIRSKIPLSDSGPIRPEFELVQDFMPVLVTIDHRNISMQKRPRLHLKYN